MNPPNVFPRFRFDSKIKTCCTRHPELIRRSDIIENKKEWVLSSVENTVRKCCMLISLCANKTFMHIMLAQYEWKTMLNRFYALSVHFLSAFVFHIFYKIFFPTKIFALSSSLNIFLLKLCTFLYYVFCTYNRGKLKMYLVEKKGIKYLRINWDSYNAK